MTDAGCEELISDRHFAAGTSREVFDVPSDPTIVVKKMILAFPGANIMEWHLWGAVKDSFLSDVFGRCLSISETGRFLIMERLDDISPDDGPRVPPIPTWVQDTLPKAFGRDANGIVKLRDYALVRLEDALTYDLKRVAWAHTKWA